MMDVDEQDDESLTDVDEQDDESLTDVDEQDDESLTDVSGGTGASPVFAVGASHCVTRGRECAV